MNKPQAEHWQLLLCFQPLLSTLQGTIAEKRQGAGLAHSLLPPSTQSLVQRQCSWLPLLPIPQSGLPRANPSLALEGS